MLNFLEFVSQLVSPKPKGTYAAVHPDIGSSKAIKSLQDKLRLTNPVHSDDLHATVCYSREPVDVSDEDMFDSWEATGDELHFFDQKNGNKCLVLKLSSVDLPAQHKVLRSLGATHDFPQYQPHVTLAYDVTDSEASSVDTGQEVSIPITFDRFTIKPLDL